MSHNLKRNIILEACVESLNEAITAEKSGAHRLELCSNLAQDGLTPDVMLVKKVMGAVKIPVKVMVRNRPGNFVYDTEEIDEMVEVINGMKRLGVKEIVIGATTDEQDLNLSQIEILASSAYPMLVTVHKCIDEVKDPIAAIQELKKIPNIHSVLTSGQASTAVEGIPVLREMLRIAGDRIKVIVAGKVTQQVLPHLLAELNATEYHGRKIVSPVLNN